MTTVRARPGAMEYKLVVAVREDLNLSKGKMAVQVAHAAVAAALEAKANHPKWFKAWMDEGQKARLVHSQWLTHALRSGKPYPRIPVRPVITGGFSRLLSRPRGSDLARRWWEIALERVD